MDPPHPEPIQHPLVTLGLFNQALGHCGSFSLPPCSPQTLCSESISLISESLVAVEDRQGVNAQGNAGLRNEVGCFLTKTPLLQLSLEPQPGQGEKEP